MKIFNKVLLGDYFFETPCRSLKIIQIGTIQKLGAVSYSPCIVTMAVSFTVLEILSVKE